MHEFATDEEIAALSPKMLAIRGLWHKSEAILTSMERLDNEPESSANAAARDNLELKLNEILELVRNLGNGRAFSAPTPDQVKRTRDALIRLIQINLNNATVTAVIDGALEIHGMALGSNNLARA